MKKTLAKVVYFFDRSGRDYVGAFASQSAYFIALSFIPCLLLLMTMIKYTPLTKEVVSGAIIGLIPDGFQKLVAGIIEEVYSKSLAVVPISALMALWSAGKGVQSLTNGLNVIYDVKETRNYLVNRLRSIFYTLLFLIAITLTLLLLVFGNSIQSALEQYVPFLANVTNFILQMRSLITMAVLALVFVMIYHFVPNQKHRFSDQLPGALLCSIAWAVFSFGFSIYVDHSSGFSNMYGSLTTIVMIMLWLYFCMYLLLLGAEVNVVLSEREEREEQDDGTGQNGL